MAMTAMNIMSQVDMPSGPTAAESQRTGGSVALSIAAPQPSSLEGSPLSPPLHGVTDVLEPACKPAGHELVQMVSIKTGVPVLITAGERQRCYGICADDMLAPQDQFDAIKVQGLLKEARSLALSKKAARLRHLRNALVAAGQPESPCAPGPAARALAEQADRAEADLRDEVDFWKNLRRDVAEQLRMGAPAMTIICQFSADRIFLR